MTSYEDLIQFETEHTSLDFKRDQYAKGRHQDLLKDVMAMANAHVGEGPRHVVVGVKLLPGGERTMAGVPRDAFIDAAIYQQLVTENIEPELPIRCEPFELDEKVFGILTLPDCSRRPYMMRKDFDKLNAGDAWIRKGTHQVRMRREDFERIYGERQSARPTESDVSVAFPGPERPDELRLPAPEPIDLPSSRARRRIESILEERKRPLAPHEAALRDLNLGMRVSLVGAAPLPYESRDTATLEKDLEEVAGTYLRDDLHEFFEKRAHHLELVLWNDSSAYLEDVRLRLFVPELEGLLVADQVYGPPPEGGIDMFLQADAVVEPFESLHYPVVTKDPGFHVITAEIGDVRHRVPTPAFEVAPRITFAPSLAGQRIDLVCEIHCRNLPDLVTRNLAIELGDAD